MNNDFISREALKKAVINNFDNLQAYFTKDFIEEIDNAPTVDIWQLRQEATENALKKAEVLYGRPQGEWLYKKPNGKTYSDFVFCSVCHKHGGFYKTNFCPNCGAKMKG